MKQGYDVFFEKPGEVSERICRICGEQCIVKHDQSGPTSWGGAMAHKSTVHDYFYCSHTQEDWHNQVLALVEAIENTPSKRLAGLMKLDLEDILRENLPGSEF
jgi:hypothetical protein